jgi:hypothetical protein
MTDETPAPCAFCAQTIDDMRVLITGPTVNICDECVVHCYDHVFAQYLPVRRHIGFAWRAFWGRAARWMVPGR